MKFLGTVVHRLAELLWNHCQHRGNLYHNYINNISPRYNEEIKKLRKLILNKFTPKQEQCALC
jgi:abortive infection bacteriophage resistance protein